MAERNDSASLWIPKVLDKTAKATEASVSQTRQGVAAMMPDTTQQRMRELISRERLTKLKTSHYFYRDGSVIKSKKKKSKA